MATSFDQIVGSYLSAPGIGGGSPTPEQKRVEVAAAAEAKKAALRSRAPDAPMYNVAAVRARGTGLSTIEDPEQRDLALLDNWSLYNRYGSDAGRMIEQFNVGQSQYSGDRQARGTVRGSSDRAKDVGLSVVQGGLNSILGIPALALGAVSDEGGTWAARKISDMNESLEDAKSDASSIARRRYGVEQSLDSADNKELYKTDRTRSGEFVASLKRIGRDTLSATKNVFSNPEMLQDTVAQGGGSLLAVAPIAKGVQLAGKAGTAVITRGAAATPLGARFAGVLGEDLARVAAPAQVPISIGLMEGGGAYQQTITDAYDNLDSRTDLTEDQKAQRANRAGLIAAAIQGPVGALTGTLVSKFEGNAGHVVNARTAVSNILREGLEEGTQGASGQFAQNLGIKSQVDQTRDLGEGVGEQIGLGAIGGIGAAGGMQAPGVALKSAVASAKLTGRVATNLGNRIVGAIDSRVQDVQDQVEAQSPVSAPKMDAAMDAASVAAPETYAAAVESVEANTSTTPEQKAEGRDYLDKLFESVKFDPTEADNEQPVIGDLIRDSSDRFDAIRRVSSLASDTKAEPMDRLDAGLYLIGAIQGHQALMERDLPEAISKIDDNDPVLPQLRDFEDVVVNLGSHPEIKKAIAGAMQVAQQLKAESLSNENISTPEGQKTAQTAVKLASLAPEQSDPEVNNRILYHVKQGSIQLTPEQTSYLEAANSLHQVQDDYTQDIKALGLTNTEFVSRQIQSDEGDADTLKKSATQHLKGITSAMQSGNEALASRRMQHLVSFAQSMQNKVQALNENLSMGGGSSDNATAYQAYNPYQGSFFKSGTPVWLSGTSESSVKTAQQVSVDARAVGNLANTLSAAFPQLGAKPVKLVDLNPAMRSAPAREAARDYRVAKKTGTLDQLLNGKTVQEAPTQAEEDAIRNERELQSERTPKVEENKKSEVVESSTRPTQSDPVETPVVRETTRVQPDPNPDQAKPDRETEDRSPGSAPVQEPQALEAVQAPSSDVEENADPEDRGSGIDAAYPDLVVGDHEEKTNIFKSTFQLPEQPVSRLTGTEEPLEDIRNAVSSASKFRGLVGGDETGARLTPDVSRAYGEYLGFADDVISNMDSQLADVPSAKLAKFLSDPKAVAFEENRALSITQRNGDALAYNQELQQNAVLAGLQWLLTSDQRGRDLSDEDVAKILQIPVTSVTDTQVQQFNQGVYLASAVNDLAGVIQRYWGVKPSSSALDGFARGIPEGVAKELMRAMETAGLLKIATIEISGKTYYQVEGLAESKLGEEKFNSLMKFPSAIEQAVAVEPEEATFIGAPPKDVPRTQLRNPLVRLTRQQETMARNEQNTAHQFNMPMFQFVEAAGPDGMVDLVGYGELSDDMNKNHRQSLESVNLTVREAARGLKRTMAEVQAQAAVDGVEVDQVPIHYRYEFTSVNRLQMVGKHNPQSNKLTREVILPTRSTLDLTNEKDRGLFMLGLAQALGVKVHKKVRAESIREVEELLSGRLAPTVSLLQDWLSKSPAKRVSELGPDQINTIRENLGDGKPVPMMALHAAMEYARYLSTSENEKSKFTTAIYVEADGITDGPINAMLHAVTGAFTTAWLKTVGKGGLFFGKPGMTANVSPDKVDLYQQTTDSLKQQLADQRHKFSRNGPVSNQMNTMLRVMDQLLPDIGFNRETGELRIDRGAVKNPLTVTIYGAGPAGIAGKITSALTKAYYERSTEIFRFKRDNPKASLTDLAVHLYGATSSSPEEARKRYDEFVSDIRQLISTQPRRADDGIQIVRNTTDEKDREIVNKTSGTDFTFTPNEVKNIQQNVLRLFVGPMQEAIASSIGETKTGVDLLRKATQVQSIYLQFAFQRGLEQAMAEKAKTVPGYKKSDFLSRKEIQAVYDKLAHLAPFVETGTQNMLVSGSESFSFADVSFSRSLASSKHASGQYATPGLVYGPKDSGVSGIPYTIIGTGDGQMMQNYSEMAGDTGGRLLIFDGANFRLDRLEEDSRLINEAVHRGWMQNPLADVARSFSEFASDAELTKGVSDAQRQALSQALLGQGKKDASIAQIKEMIDGLKSDFDEAARTIQARKNVLARVQMTVDHMASAEASFDSKGESLENLSDEQITDRLNQLYTEELAKLSQKKAEAPSENIKSELGKFGNVLVADSIGFIRELNIPSRQKALMLDAATRLDGSWLITTEPLPSGSGQNILGATDFSTKKIHVLNGSSETLLHEMIHAATSQKISDRFTDPSLLSNEEIEAVDRMQALMDEWLEIEASNLNVNDRISVTMDHAQNTVRTMLGNQDAAGAISEFSAYVLANQDLSKVAERTKVKGLIARIVGEALRSLKELIWGKARALKVGDDLYSNLRFNTQILMRSGTRTIGARVSDIVHFHTSAYVDERLSKIESNFAQKIAAYIRQQPNPAAQLTATKKVDEASARATQVGKSFAAAGFLNDMQQKGVFEMLIAALGTEIGFNPNSLSRAQELYAHVTKMLKVEDLMRDPEADVPGDRAMAQEKYNELMGLGTTPIDERGRSSLLPAFLAISVVDPQMREILSQMDLPKNDRLPNTSLDNVLSNFANESMDRLSQFMAGEGINTPSVRASMDQMIDQVSTTIRDQESWMSQFANVVATGLDTGNSWVVQQMTRLSEAADQKLKKVGDETNRKSVKAATSAGQMLLGFVNKDIAEGNAIGVMSAANQYMKSKTSHDFLNELVGRTRENASVYDMIKAVKSRIQAIRQKFREKLPAIIQKQFSRPLTEAELGHMFDGLAKTDIASLRSGYSQSQILEMIADPTKVANERSTVENRISNSPNGKLILRKSAELARYMNTGHASYNLLRNAGAIANLLGEGVKQTKIESGLLKDVDHYVTLLALEGLNQEAKDSLSSLAQDEKTGIDFVTAYLHGQRQAELDGLSGTGREAFNYWKGYIPSIQESKHAGKSLVIANDDEYRRLRTLGYERVAGYEGSRGEFGKARMGYYFTPLSGQSGFNQGIMQTVRRSVAGIDPATGFSTSMTTAGQITDADDVVRTARRLKNVRAAGNDEHLLPVYSDTGEIVAYERAVNPDQVERLGLSRDITRMLGVWRGRQEEEGLAEAVNRTLIDRLGDMWNKTETTRRSEFINVFDRKELKADPVMADAVSLIGSEARRQIEGIFGTGEFWVRRDMLNNALGYRKASAGDSWTGNTRFSPATQKAITDMATAAFGVKAYQYFVRAERLLENVVTDAKTTVVVRSVIVPVGNIVSNMYQLAANGVPMLTAGKSMLKKTAETESYVKGLVRSIEIEGELRAAKGSNDTVRTRKLETENQTIKDGWKRMSIWPLIETGELNSVSDTGIGKEDLDLAEGKLGEYVEKLVGRLPPSLKTLGRYAWVTTDTALFKGLEKAVEYGDFLAKSILYDDMVERRGLSKEEALAHITEEFVNYNFLSGRTMDKMDALGAIWFWRFKVRSVKVALRMMRDNPVNALMSMLIPAPPIVGSVGSPLTDNFFSKLADGKLGYSIGPGQLWGAHSLNPWAQMTGLSVL